MGGNSLGHAEKKLGRPRGVSRWREGKKEKKRGQWLGPSHGLTWPRATQLHDTGGSNDQGSSFSSDTHARGGREEKGGAARGVPQASVGRRRWRGGMAATWGGPGRAWRRRLLPQRLLPKASSSQQPPV
jgi:hypothetical protein